VRSRRGFPRRRTARVSRWGAALLAAALLGLSAAFPRPAGGQAEGAEQADRQTAGPLSVPVPRPSAALEAGVRAAIAERWSVAAEQLHVEWQSAQPAQAVADDAVFRLTGTGARGMWTVALTVPDSGGREIRLRVRAGVVRPAAIAARALPRGVVLTDADVTVAPMPWWGPPVDVGELPGAGWVTRRSVAAGEQLSEPTVGRPTVVRAGEPVHVLWRQGGIELKLRGTAAGSASLGERVAVRIDSRRRMEGIASGPALVRIN
jgi:flagella basal body P-ring formation protein FlgA